MTTQNSTNIHLKTLLESIPANTVVTAKKLSESGISHNLMHYYEKSEWLRRIGTGAYVRLNENPDINGALYALQNDLQLNVHTGAQTALAVLYNKVQYAKTDQKIQLFASGGIKLPAWFIQKYSTQFTFRTTDFLPSKSGMITKEYGTFSLEVPSLERSLLEMLFLVPGNISVQEAYQITELIQSVKPALMQDLLENCSSIKVTRLLFSFADHAGLQWVHTLDTSRIDFGSGIRTIEKNGRLDSVYKLVISEF